MITLLLAATVLAVAFPLAGAADSLCNPVEDHGVTKVETPTMTLYVRTSNFVVRPPVAAPMVSHVWRETNGIPGLQTNSSMACGASPDFDQVETSF